MKKFKYVAINIDRQKFSGIYFADNEEHLRELLSEQQLFLISCKAIKDKSPNPFFSLTGKISIKELTAFCRQLSIMISSSIELINAIEVLKGQPFTKYFKQVLEMVYEDMKSGKMLSEAMEKHKKVFPEFFRSMVYVGEMSSSLDKVLLNVASYYETESRTRAKLKSAMVYPITLMVMMVGILAIMMIFVVPTFKASLSELEIDMPLITMAIFNASDYVVENWKMIFLILIGVIVLFKLWAKSKSGRKVVDAVKMQLPLLRRYEVAKVTAKFSRGFGLLIASGMTIVDSMEVIERVLDNKFVQKKFRQAIEDVRKGESLKDALGAMKVFPIMLIQMISVGERTASMSEVLLRSCDYFDEEVQNALNGMMAMVQPILMLVMGVLIGIIFIGVYSPMISIMENIV